jgi:hypothetical protein
MVQINLLPDVKREYLHAQQSKHAFIVGAALVSVISIVLLGFVYAYVEVVQPRHQTNLQTDIDNGIAQSKEVPDGVEMVTVQGALEQLPELQDNKQITSRLFKYVNGFTPKDVSYSEVKLNLTDNTLSLRGQTTNYEQTNVLANNLKSAEMTYTENDAQNVIKPFSQVVFTNLGRAEQSQSSQNVSFQIDTIVDTTMFSEGVSKIELKVSADSKELLIPTAKPFGAKKEGGANE